MNLSHVKKIYEFGLGICYDSSFTEEERGFAVVVADHMTSFRTQFIYKLDQFHSVLRNIKTGEECIIEGEPHKSLIDTSVVIKRIRPDHAELISLNRKLQFASINNGNPETLLQCAGRVNGPIELIIRKKNTEKKEIPKKKSKGNLDDEMEMNNHFMQMIIDGKTSF